jgi:hypothetical protein
MAHFRRNILKTTADEIRCKRFSFGQISSLSGSGTIKASHFEIGQFQNSVRHGAASTGVPISHRR